MPDATDPPIDPELGVIVADWRDRMALRPPLVAVTPAEMRARASAEFAVWNLDPPPLAEVRDITIAGEHPLRARLYDPVPGEPGGLLIYFHGGGWVIGDLDLEDGMLRRLAAASGVRIVSVDYALAPERPFPAAIEDGAASYRWAVANAASLAVDPARIALGGSSAGANVALGTALALRVGGVSPSFLLLLHGAYSGGVDTESARRFGDGRYGLAAPAMTYFWSAYLGSAGAHPRAVPLGARLDGLPPAFVHHAELDILADDSRLLVERLQNAGVEVTHRGYRGATHGFTQYARASTLARTAIADAAMALAAALAPR